MTIPSINWALETLYSSYPDCLLGFCSVSNEQEIGQRHEVNGNKPIASVGSVQLSVLTVKSKQWNRRSFVSIDIYVYSFG